jgi:hypothetical protein
MKLWIDFDRRPHVSQWQWQLCTLRTDSSTALTTRPSAVFAIKPLHRCFSPFLPRINSFLRVFRHKLISTLRPRSNYLLTFLKDPTPKNKATNPKKQARQMEPPAAPVLEHEYAEETQGATQQASQYAAYGNAVHPMESPFFGCLQPCNTALRRIDFQKTQPNNAIGRGPTNNFILPGMRISACLALPWCSISPIASFLCAVLTTRFYPFFSLGEQASIIVRSCGMDARIAIPKSSCTTTRRTVPGYVSSPLPQPRARLTPRVRM